MHEFRFPNETDGYREARDELLRAEIDLRRATEAVARQRRALPLGGVVADDYAFTELDGQTTRMSELFEHGRNTLIVYNLMFGPDDERPCPSCSSIADVLDGAAPHMSARVAFVFVAKASPERIAELAAERGWSRLRLLSSHLNTYNRDYLGETSDGAQMPMLNVFRKDGTKTRHFWGSELLKAPADEGQDERHVDMFWPIWALADVTPEGRPGADDYSWPALDYAAALSLTP